jgi:hypothetical protein
MELLASWNIQHGDAERRIELLHGDLSRIPPEHNVDILVVSAFPNDYSPTFTSLIGALSRRGVSVWQLAQAKEMDLRQDYSCWLSHPVLGATGFRRILCIESGWRGTPVEITDDLFRALAPVCLSDSTSTSVAMPIIGAGDQGAPTDKMIESIMQASFSWMNRGIPISLLKIVVFSSAEVEKAKQKFVQIRDEHLIHVSKEPLRSGSDDDIPEEKTYDVFLSYSHEDFDPAQLIVETLRQSSPAMRIFFDRRSLVHGRSWLMDIAESLDNAKRVATLFTPHYWTSSYCKDEFTAAFTRQQDTGKPVIFPIYFQSARIPYLFRNLQFEDCREANMSAIPQVCAKFMRHLSSY